MIVRLPPTIPGVDRFLAERPRQPRQRPLDARRPVRLVHRRCPRRCPTSGRYNEHFVRDIGATFTMLGARPPVWAPPCRRWASPRSCCVTLFYGAARARARLRHGRAASSRPAHWTIDFPGVYAPTILLIVLTLRVRAAARPAHEPRVRIRVARRHRVGIALGCLPIVHYWFAAPHARHGHTHAPAPSAPEKE